MANSIKAEAATRYFQQAVRGDHESLQQLLASYVGYLSLLSRVHLDKRIQHRVSPSDIVQETLMEAHRDFANFDAGGIEEFGGWLRQILVHNIANAVGKHVLAEKRSVRREQVLGNLSASLHHPHIVPVFAVGCERGVHYYSMQLIEGRTLEQVFNELSPEQPAHPITQGAWRNVVRLPHQTTADAPVRGKSDVSPLLSNMQEPFRSACSDRRDFSRDVHLLANDTTRHHGTTARSIGNRNYVHDTVESLICVAEAIDFAHQQGVVHRDIKPSNLLVDSCGKIWVADFGLAQIRGVGNLTAEGKVMGTARYMSPEQVAARTHQIDHRTDIYSLGITLYELLTLRPAFDSENRETLLRLVENTQPIAPRRLNPAIAIDLETIVLKAIAKSRDDRYATAGQFAEDLRRYLEGKPTLARRPTHVERAFKWAVRRQRFVCTVLLLLLVAMIGMTTAICLISRESRLKDQAVARAHLHLDQAHALVDRFGGTMTRGLASLPDTESLREEMLREAERYYLDFLKYAEQDSSLRGELAKVRYRLAATYGELGQLDFAERKYQEAISAYDELQHPSQWTADDRADMALCFHNLAALQKDRGSYAEAISNYSRATQLQDALIESEGNVTRFLQEWAMTRNNLGLLLWQYSEAEAATEMLRGTESKLQAILLHSPHRTQLHQPLIECRNTMVATVIDHDLTQAEELLRANIRDLRTVVDAGGPTREEGEIGQGGQSVEVQLAISQNNLANVLGRKGNRDEGLQVVRQTIEFLEKSVSDDHTGAADSREQLAIAQNNLGQLLWSNPSDQQAALAAFQVARKLLSAPSHRRAEQPESLSRLAGVLHNLAVAYQCSGSERTAIDCVTESMELQARAVKLAPFNLEYRKFLGEHRELLDQLLSQVKDSRTDLRQGLPTRIDWSPQAGCEVQFGHDASSNLASWAWSKGSDRMIHPKRTDRRRANTRRSSAWLRIEPLEPRALLAGLSNLADTLLPTSTVLPESQSAEVSQIDHSNLDQDLAQSTEPDAMEPSPVDLDDSVFGPKQDWVPDRTDPIVIEGSTNADDCEQHDKETEQDCDALRATGNLAQGDADDSPRLDEFLSSEFPLGQNAAFFTFVVTSPARPTWEPLVLLAQTAETSQANPPAFHYFAGSTQFARAGQPSLNAEPLSAIATRDKFMATSLLSVQRSGYVMAGHNVTDKVANRTAGRRSAEFVSRLELAGPNGNSNDQTRLIEEAMAAMELASEIIRDAEAVCAVALTVPGSETSAPDASQSQVDQATQPQIGLAAPVEPLARRSLDTKLKVGLFSMVSILLSLQTSNASSDQTRSRRANKQRAARST